MITKELFSEVLGIDCEYAIIDGSDVWPQTFVKWKKGKMQTENAKEYRCRPLNIHELAHKCKEWAYSKGYEIVSFKKRVEIWDENAETRLYCTVDSAGQNNVFNTDLEFKACQWILEQLAGHKCEAIQYSDQMVCKRCNQAWDVNDFDPPKCKKD